MARTTTKRKPTPPQPRNRGGNRRNNELAARVLAEAAFYNTGIRVAEKYGVPRSTYFEWQNAVEKDEQLGRLYMEALADLAQQQWKEDLNASIRRSVEKVTAMIEGLEPGPENLKVALEAVQQLMRWETNRVVAEIEIARARQEPVGWGEGGADDPLPERPQA